MVLRLSEPGDADSIARVHVLSWQWAYRGLMPDEHLDSLSIEQQAAARRTWMERGNRPIVALVDGEVVGFCDQGRARDHDASPATGEVQAIYLLPEVAGRGVGLALWRAALKALRQAQFEHVTVWVLDGNARARRFYERAGMVEDGAVKVDERHGFPLREVRYGMLLASRRG